MSTDERKKNGWTIVEKDGHRTISVERKKIDWDLTKLNLVNLRLHNPDLRRYVCSQLKHETCEDDVDCTKCNIRFIAPYITRPMLAKVIGVSVNALYNWERGKTLVDYEDLLFYCAIAKVKLEDIIVFEASDCQIARRE